MCLNFFSFKERNRVRYRLKHLHSMAKTLAPAQPEGSTLLRMLEPHAWEPSTKKLYRWDRAFRYWTLSASLNESPTSEGCHFVRGKANGVEITEFVYSRSIGYG